MSSTKRVYLKTNEERLLKKGFMRKKILSTFCLLLVSLSLNAQEFDNAEKLDIIDKISNSLSAVTANADKSEESIDCYIKQAKIDVSKATFLWSDLAKINKNLVNQTLNNFDDLLVFVKYLDKNNDPDSLGSIIYMLHAFSELAVKGEPQETIFDNESMLALMKIAQSEPFNATIDPIVFDIIAQIDNIEISKRKKGDYKGETKIVIHNKEGKNISMNINDMVELESDKFSARFIIADGAQVTFIDGKNSIQGVTTLDEKAIKKKNKKIRDVVRGVKSEKISKIEKKAEKNLNELLKPLKNDDGEDVATFDSHFRNHIFSSRAVGRKVTQLQSDYASLQASSGPHEDKELFAKYFANYITEKKLKKREVLASDFLSDHPQSALLSSKTEELRSASLTAILDEERRKRKIDFDENFNEVDQEKIINFVEEQSDAIVATPLYFRVKGIKLSGQANKVKVAGVKLGKIKAPANLQVKEGVLLPGLRVEGRDTNNSAFIKVSASLVGVNLGGVGAARYLPL